MTRLHLHMYNALSCIHKHGREIWPKVLIEKRVFAFGVNSHLPIPKPRLDGGTHSLRLMSLS